MSRLTEKINCVECGEVRMITRACLSLVKRCKACQKIFNKDKARNRYREIKGISLDDPINNIIKKKKPKKKTIEPKKEQFPIAAASPSSKPAQESSEEKELRLARINKLMGLLEDNGSDDDW